MGCRVRGSPRKPTQPLVGGWGEQRCFALQWQVESPIFPEGELCNCPRPKVQKACMWLSECILTPDISRNAVPCITESRLPWLRMAAERKVNDKGKPANVAHCGRSWRWGHAGSYGSGLGLRADSHEGKTHVTGSEMGLPCVLERV